MRVEKQKFPVLEKKTAQLYEHYIFPDKIELPGGAKNISEILVFEKQVKKKYMKQVKDINKTMSSLEKKLQKRLDNVSKQTGKKYKKVKLQRFEPEDFIRTA